MLLSGAARTSEVFSVTIALRELDPMFKYEVSTRPGGENLKYCFACGICTAGCPVSEIDETYNPRKIIRMVLLGMKKEVLSSDTIWLCSSCYTCYSHCPQDVKFSEVMVALRDMAVEEGYVDSAFVKAIEEVDKLAQKIRRELVIKALNKKKSGAAIDPKELLSTIDIKD